MNDQQAPRLWSQLTPEQRMVTRFIGTIGMTLILLPVTAIALYMASLTGIVDVHSKSFGVAVLISALVVFAIYPDLWEWRR